MNTVFSYALTAVALLMTIVLHELGHGYVALWQGDFTAKDAGRLTLNPIKHVDPIGLVCLYVFKLGWAKPVPINPSRFTNYRKGMLLVSIAGVTVNLILAFLSAFLLRFFATNALLADFLSQLFFYNIAFFVFNLLPIPPLDGSRLITTFLPYRTQYVMAKYERYSYFLLLALSWSGLLARIMVPFMQRLASGVLRLVLR